MHKIIASVSLMMCLSSSVSAMDYRDLSQGEILHIIGWEVNNMEDQSSTFSKMHNQINKLEEENEQLRNSVSRLDAGQGRVTKSTKSDPRIQALVEENKRLMALLKNNGSRELAPSASESVYAGKIATLRNENQKLTETLNQRDNGTGRIVLLQRKVKELRNENSYLELKLLERSSSSADEILLQGKDSEISSLLDKLGYLRRENQRLSLSVSKSSQKEQGNSVRANEVEHAYKNNLKALEALNERIDKVKLENKKLTEALSNKDISNAGRNDQVSALKMQNKSLRATIKAQNEDLISADNAITTAERLLTENQILKRNLKLSGKSNTANNRTTQELIERNKKLLNGIIQRDKYIKKLNGLKETVKLLRKENDRLLLGQANNGSKDIKFYELSNLNNSLRGDLERERENVISYRTKIKEYQDTISKLDNKSQDSTFESKVDFLNETLASFKLENQELKARIEILSKEKKSVVFHKADVYADVYIENDYTDSKGVLGLQTLNSDVGFVRGKKETVTSNSNDKKVTYIQTKYPPVDQVIPVLKLHGTHTNAFEAVEVEYDQNAEDMSLTSAKAEGGAIKPEDLLAQELNPLTY